MEKFTVNLSEELIDFVSPDNKDDLLSETVKSRQKLTDELGYVIPRMVFQDEEEIDAKEIAVDSNFFSASFSNTKDII